MKAKIQYLVRRKVGGMYATNVGYHARMAGKPLWSDDMQECRPFRSANAAKSAMVAYLFVRFGDARGHGRIPFEDKFELVPVRLIMEVVA